MQHILSGRKEYAAFFVLNPLWATAQPPDKSYGLGLNQKSQVCSG